MLTWLSRNIQAATRVAVSFNVSASCRLHSGEDLQRPEAQEGKSKGEESEEQWTLRLCCGQGDIRRPMIGA